MPPTIEALIAARVDQLPNGERAALERASVIGRQFGATEVAELTPPDERASVRAALLALVRKDLIRPDPDAFLSVPDDEPYRFRHQLIRDAAYAGLPKQARAEAHESYAARLERGGNELPQLDELVGHHLGEAHRYRSELGGQADEAQALAERAASRLGAAGVRAVDRGDMPAGASLLRRAIALLPAGDLSRKRLIPALAEALVELVEWTEASTLLAEAADAPDLVTRAAAAAIDARLVMTRGQSVVSLRPELEGILRDSEAAGADEAVVRTLSALQEVAFF